ncbi:Similar to Cfap410: Cilia- and flagella-associated protein 410 (Mus musculus) [Cotesia congregata]|uniref:Similar to Cfap410: Cilia- and flagella-associated protein 410 (Mus musculus) n=1 Tax=Cotesia congregata TaxID=51543 RepID=A0A8J2HD89_COTCN|nr:Similar to Cfap410: Cilia- and flagella-associated protein 410 (Mus musculus) [Cotesia congregata]
MVRLTEEMVVARSRISDLTAVKKLNCWGSELTDVSILRELKKVEVLSLSVNKINSLADFQYCSNLKDLFVRRNNITDLNEICYLQNLPNLRNLWLEENPCAEREGYRMSVIRALPNLEKLDDKFVTADEINVALSRGKILVHPLSMDASPPQSDPASPEEVAEFIDEVELERNRRYSSSSDQRSYDDPHQGHEEYQDTDRRNANYNASSPHQYSQNNHYSYDLQNGQTKNQIKDEAAKSVESRTNGHSLQTNIPEVSKDYDDRPAVARQNGDYEDRRGYSTEYERSSEPSTHRSQQVLPSPRTAYSEDPREMPGWVRHAEKEKCRFHYHRRPVTRNSNILSAVLCLVKELDYPSLEVVEMAVRNRMDELEE